MRFPIVKSVLSYKLQFTALLGSLAIATGVMADADQLRMMRNAQIPFPSKGWTKGDEGGIADVSFPASGVELLAWLPIGTLDPASTSASVVEGYVSPSGKEYAVIGISGGSAYVNVTDPGNPSLVAFVPSVSSLWRDIQIFGSTCYTVSEGGNGIQVIDLSLIDNGVVTAIGNVNTPNGSSTSSHTLALNKESGYLYRCGGGSTLGIRIYDANSTPTNPAYVTTMLAGRYVHECQVVTYTSGPYAGKEIAFCYSDSSSGGGATVGIDILDVTNKAAIVPLSFTTYANSKFSHQGWLSADKQYIYQDDELDEQQAAQPTLTRVFNVSNLSAPTFVGSFGNGLGAIDHNQYTEGNLLFQSNYRTGLRVWDVSNPIAPTEIAFFDTYPPDNNASFNGLWDNYPYLPSGIVLGSDIEKGLFVWNIGPNMLTFAYPNGNPALIPATGATIAVSITNQSGTLLPGSAKLQYDTGSGFVAVNLVPVSGNLYNAVFPSLPCGAQVKYFISAQTTSGTTVRSPQGAPANTFSAAVASSIQTGAADNMETNLGWVPGLAGDTATTGIWTRVDPVGTSAQPEDDHTPFPGVNCWVTGQGVVGGGAGDNDVDGGSTTLTSPTMDATGGDAAFITYWRWYSNNTGGDPNNDSMPVSISNNNGASWIQMELVVENAGDWVKKSFRISDFVTATNQMKLRFVARDLGSGSLVEAGVDDVQIEYYNCTPVVAGDVTGDGLVNIDDLLAVINAWGNCPAQPAACPADVAVDGLVNIDDLLFVINHWT